MQNGHRMITVERDRDSKDLERQHLICGNQDTISINNEITIRQQYRVISYTSIYNV